MLGKELLDITIKEKLLTLGNILSGFREFSQERDLLVIVHLEETSTPRQEYCKKNKEGVCCREEKKIHAQLLSLF